jgi:hypothetical protein
MTIALAESSKMESLRSKTQIKRLRISVKATAKGIRKNSSRLGKRREMTRRGRRRMFVKAWGRRAFLFSRIKGEVSPAERAKKRQANSPHFTRLKKPKKSSIPFYQWS